MVRNSSDPLAIKEIFQDKLLSWNTDGYEGLPDGMLIWEVDLGHLHACHPTTGTLLRIQPIDDRTWQVDAVSGYSPETFQLEASEAVQMSTHRFNVSTGASLTDVRLGAETRRLYILDLERTCIRVLNMFPRLTENNLQEVREIQITLPAGVVLDRNSRLEVVPQDPDAPERKDPFFYVSCPAASVILKVDSDSGIATVALGRVGRAGKTKAGLDAREVLLRSPGAMCYDARSAMLFWVDSGARVVLVLAGGKVFEVAQFPTNTEITSMVVYRLVDHVDKMLIESKSVSYRTSFWRDDPALLFVADSKSSQIYKVRLYEGERKPHAIFSRTFSGSILSQYQRPLERILVLPDGDLIITTKSKISYHLRYGIGPHSDPPRDELAT